MGKFGQLFKERRIELGKTLREFCLEHGLDPGNTSRLERGMMAPPQDPQKIEEYAGYLQVKKGSDLWYQFFDSAALESGKIPKDILEEKELVKKLPVFFRVLRGKKATREALKELIEKIRKA